MMQIMISSMQPSFGPLGQTVDIPGDKKGCWDRHRHPLLVQSDQRLQQRPCRSVTSPCIKRQLSRGKSKGYGREQGSIQATAAAEALSPAVWESSRLDGKLKIIGAEVLPAVFCHGDTLYFCGSGTP